ncbi:hypothetical protein LPJ60_004017 [Coemansia sp. RSA 2675]|nr:hypothetical protein LPJ60_004017 [Coemansia sp. RSA 2675]
MATAQHDDELDVCWFARGTSISLRWVWVTLNIWVVLSLLFLIATSIYVGVILSNERRDLMSFMHSSAARVSANGGSAEHIKGDGAQMPSFYYPSMGARHSQVPVNYYYNRSNLVVDVPPNSVGMGFCARSTPLASRESLGLSRGGNEVSPGAAPPSGNGSKCRPAPLMIYPANHPISLAHEALHGRRPLTSRSRDSALKSSDCSRHPTGVSAHRTAHSPMAQYSGRTSSSGHSVCESCKRSPSTGIQSERSLRHHSEIISAARYYSLSRQQWGVGMSSSGVADRMHYCRPLSSGLVYMVGNDSESRISAALPWDSSRRLIHKPSYASTTAATSQGQRASPLASDRPLYGFYAQRSVAAPVAGKCNGQKCRRMAKHMSMPVPCGSVGCHGYSTSPVEPESSEGCATYMATRHARQLSMPPDTQQSSRQSGATCTQVGQGRWYGSQPFSTGAGEAAAPLGLMPRPSLAQMGAAKAAGGMGATAHVDSCPGKPPNVSGDGTKARTGPKRGWGWSVGGLFCGGAGGKRGETQGQMQRIERRVHMLVATGALRVATRAMVPLVTQLCMVVWSTMHALNAAGVQTVYSAAILLLSTQGLLDMALYHIFDTQADDSDVSLPSGIPLSSLNAGSASSGKAERSFAPPRHQSHAATPRASHDRASSNWHRHGRASAEAKRWAMNRSHQRSISLTSGGSADRRFVFNVDSLNIRRADRTSNAMQSDTLHDGDVAWSHMDALSAHDTRSISQFSALGAHIQHQPVLSGWEEEESPRSSAHFPD